MDETVKLVLTRDEAIVFFEWLWRFNAGQTHQFDDQAEQRVLWNLEAALESCLPEPLRQDYESVLAKARARVRDSTL